MLAASMLRQQRGANANPTRRPATCSEHVTVDVDRVTKPPYYFLIGNNVVYSRTARRSVCLSVCRPVGLSVCLSVCLSVPGLGMDGMTV